ncbi:hypothetical protein [Acinetobacter sp. YH12251]|uniref:hypothetical protein n=2 Tax=Acinetobacter TaxID=469 RepID=UPI0015D2A7B6|nr:hypothetical protein [Acinetobacter sp. YH12251]
MYRKFYPNYLLLNLVVSLILIGVVMYPQHLLFNYWVAGLHWFIGIVLMHILIIRLPIFKQFYINRNKLKNVVIQTSKYNQAEHKAARVMSALVVFVVVCLVLYGLNLTQFYIEYAFIAGFSAGNMSGYYTP